jgi:hypothetical protein
MGTGSSIAPGFTWKFCGTGSKKIKVASTVQSVVFFSHSIGCVLSWCGAQVKLCTWIEMRHIIDMHGVKSHLIPLLMEEDWRSFRSESFGHGALVTWHLCRIHHIRKY